MTSQTIYIFIDVWLIVKKGIDRTINPFDSLLICPILINQVRIIRPGWTG